MLRVRYYLVASCLVLASGVLGVEAKTVTVHAGDDLRAAVSQLHSGDTLLLEPGIYTDGFGGAIPSKVTLRATQPRQAIIQSGNGTAIALWGTQHDIVFDGLVIDKFNQASGEGLILREQAYNVTFENGEVRNFLGTGTCSPSMAFGPGNLTVRNSYIHDIGTDDPPANITPCTFSYGIYLAGNDTVLENNVWANISAFAIHGYPSPHNNIIRGNVLCNTGPLLIQGSGNTVEGNQFYHVGQTVYPWERGKTLMIAGGNSQNNNQVSADDSICGW